MNDELVPGFAEPFAVERQEPNVPYWQAFKSGFQLENDVLNAWEFLSRDKFRYDPEYDNVATLKSEGLWDFRNSFTGTKSREEFDYRRGKLREEQQKRRDYMMGGWPGFFGAVAGGVISPTMFIPLVGPSSRGGRALAEGLMLATTAGVLQEIPLQLNQYERTAFESATSIIGQAVVGGVLGGLVGLLRKGQLEEIAGKLGRDADMATLPGEEAIPKLGREASAPQVDLTVDDLIVRNNVADLPVRQAEADFDSMFRSPEDDFAELFGGRVPLPETATRGVVTAETKAPISLPIDYVKSLPKSFADNLDDGKELVIRVNHKGEAFVHSGIYKVNLATAEQVKEINARIEWINGAEGSKGKFNPEELVSDLNKVKNAKVVEPFAATPADLKAESAGAAASFQPTDGVKKTWATKVLDRGIANLSPVLRVIEQPGVPDSMKFMTARWVMQQLSNAGVRMADNVMGIATASGGTVEELARTHYGRFWEAQPKVDEIYWKYATGKEQTPSFAMNFRANRGRESGKISRHEFNERISRAIREKAPDSIPEVNQAAEVYNSVVFEPMLKDAVEVGIYKEIPELVADKGYLTRMWVTSKVRANQNRLIDDLTKHYIKDLEARFFESAAKFKESQAKGKQFEEDVAMPFEQADLLRKEFLEKLKEEELKRPADIVASEDQIVALKERLNDLRAQRRDWKPDPTATDRKSPFDAEIEQLREKIKAHEEMLLQESRDFAKMKSETRRRINNLNKSFALQANKAAGKLAKIERMEQLNADNLGRLTRAVRRVYDNIDRLDDKVLDAQLGKLRNEFERVGGIYDRTEAKLLDEPDFQKSMSLEDLQETRREKLSDLAEDIATKEALDREFARDWLANIIERLEAKSARLIERRGMRMQRMVDEIKDLDPKLVKERIDKVIGKNKARKEAFLEEWRLRGLEDVQGALEGEKPDFAVFAKQEAEDVVRTLARQTVRLPQHEIIIGKRGPERARMLTIPSEVVSYALENDVEKVVRSYIRTMSADIEMARRFGDINATRWLSTDPENLGQLAQEYSARLESIRSAVDKKGNPLSAEEKQRAEYALSQEYGALRDRIQAVIDRIRHVRGIPEDPDSFAWRAGHTVTNLNVLRYMGMATISSFSDVSNIILKHGLTRTFRDIFIPLITNFKQMQLSAREAYLAGEALDVLIHTRANAAFDIFDEFGDNHTRFERGIGYMANRMGLIAGFDFWTREMKKLAAVGTTAHIMDSMKLVVESARTKAQRAQAEEYLASLGLDGTQIDRIWKQVQDVNGGNKVNGLWWPNTQAWTDEQAKRAFRAALTGEVSNTIITPGVERPLWMDKNIGWRMVGQFRSFGMSSTTKTLYAGLQQPDMALINSTLFSLALGAMSYYTWAVATGGDALDEANKFDPGKWADEAIARSGKLAIGQEGWELAQRLPFLRDYSTFSGQRTAQRQGMDFIELFAGPSFDFANTAGAVILNADEPTQSTIHKLRLLLPFQNLAFFRQALDRIEESVPVPERRN